MQPRARWSVGDDGHLEERLLEDRRCQSAGDLHDASECGVWNPGEDIPAGSDLLLLGLDHCLPQISRRTCSRLSSSTGWYFGQELPQARMRHRVRIASSALTGPSLRVLVVILTVCVLMG